MAVDFSLYLITDRRQLASGYDLGGAVKAALQGGVRAVQLREKDLSTEQLYKLALQLRILTRRYGAQLLINDRVDIALAVAADGVHLTEHSLPVGICRRLLGDKRLIAVSCHSLERAVQVEHEGADFITFSPVYFTPSKAGYGPPQGVEKLRRVCRQLQIPVFAFGGVTAERQRDVVRAGAAGSAVIAAILASENPQKAAQEFSCC